MAGLGCVNVDLGVMLKIGCYSGIKGAPFLTQGHCSVGLQPECVIEVSGRLLPLLLLLL